MIVSVCLCWAPLLHSYTYQTNEYWIIIRQIVNSSSNVLSNSTCVFCYVIMLCLYFVLRFCCCCCCCCSIECRIPFAAYCFPSSPALQTTQWPFSHMHFQFNTYCCFHRSSCDRMPCLRVHIYFLCKSRYQTVNDILMHFLIVVLYAVRYATVPIYRFIV